MIFHYPLNRPIGVKGQRREIKNQYINDKRDVITATSSRGKEQTHSQRRQQPESHADQKRGQARCPPTTKGRCEISRQCSSEANDGRVANTPGT